MTWQNGKASAREAELFDDLIRVIEHREMPPEDASQLSSVQRTMLLQTLREALHQSLSDQAERSQAPIRRLNRFQYNNAVVDLFQLDCVVFTLPEKMVRVHRDYFRPETGVMADTVVVGSRPLGKSQLIEPRLAGVAMFPQDLRAEHGFDNQADHLSLSPLLMESFLKLSQSITQSPDFTPRRVGIWNDFFAPPSAGQDEIDVIVRDRMQWFLGRAFRRKVSDELLNRYTSFVIRQIHRGVPFTDAMKAVAAAAIASPNFLYLYDGGTREQETSPLTDFELASRLSFFLWGSLPDKELSDLASAGKLQDANVLSGQVDRMLRDRKIKRFCDSFPAQWLQLDRIISSLPDPEQFPEFYFAKYRDSMHMMVEPLLLFETVLIENQSITQFIDSDFTYRSLLLREAYREEIPAEVRKNRHSGEVTTLTFDRLPVNDRRYGGLITNAAVMTMTSGPNRTQPITRGAWLASVIFNDPPDPPPADVPPLPEKPPGGEEQLTLRERLSAHRERADCRGCHEQIDPLGFALENYNPIGVWRDSYQNGRDVDMSGVLFQKHAFGDVIEFKDAILAEKDRFARGFSGHVLSFALARRLDASDRAAVDLIAQETAADDYRIQTLIKHVVLSEPFRRKYTPQSEPHSDVSD
ncbi:DUF1592 domain-containing protein [Roseiconus nitratireducens]|uniref:DUF1592 domain-containing protein n=2 Tax=Roseiconus nitratireducens TaxID=2605748 RepID=A0A5M6DFY6_9BACT|nr:DUF1592 domain-containing protein [Roseiconus nitratireducens]